MKKLIDWLKQAPAAIKLALAAFGVVLLTGATGTVINGFTGMNDVQILPAPGAVTQQLGRLYLGVATTAPGSSAGIYNDGVFEQDGAATFNGAVALNGTNTVDDTATYVTTAATVSLTSPTVTFSATNKHRITIQSDANQTGVHPVGGTTGQILIIVAGSGSNTMRFDDDATSMTIGGNITLTEGQNDALTLQCIAAPESSSGYGVWAALNNHDN